MKKIIISLVFLVTLPSIVFGGNAAPYTEDALQKITKAASDTPKVELTDQLSQEEFFNRFMEYYSKIFEKAGYSFNDTINQIVADLKNNPEAIPQDQQSIYNSVYIILQIMMSGCNASQGDCLQYFPPDTRESMQWLMENSEFRKQDKNKHHGGK